MLSRTITQMSDWFVIRYILCMLSVDRHWGILLEMQRYKFYVLYINGQIYGKISYLIGISCIKLYMLLARHFGL